MPDRSTLTRRSFLRNSATVAGVSGLLGALPLPSWAMQVRGNEPDALAGAFFNLRIGPTPVSIAGQIATALGINGSVPGPLLRFREGSTVTLDVHNELEEDTSIHWHGLLLPTNMDGVPGLSFAGIKPGQKYRYRYDVVQNGTYWYHSHSGLQEQSGVYGPLIIDAAEPEPFTYDREFVVLLSDWTFEDPERVFANLKMQDDYYNGRRPVRDVTSMWSEMRMSQTDIADVSALTYTYLLNGRDAASNWTGLFRPGERVRLRFINGSAMSFFNVRIPGLTMTIVQADGQNVTPVGVEEFQIGVAETYDAIVTPADQAYTLMAESMDRSGFVRGTLAPRAGMSATVPPLREPPTLTMRDMGMGHGDMGMDHGGTNGHAMHRMQPVEHNHRRGPGVANLNEMPLERLDEPGLGLENVPHKALCYADLRSVDPNRDQRPPGRTMELHLTGNMHRYMWSFDGVKFSEVESPLRFDYGERLRLVLVNDTMMSHPIHLHGMFFELVNGNGLHNPRKHTINVKPAERLAIDVTADAPGHWAFHCHLLYHMKAGMMQSVLVAAPEQTV